MKKLITTFAVAFLTLGAVLFLLPQISNQIGKAKSRSVIEEFEEIKGNLEQTNPSDHQEDANEQAHIPESTSVLTKYSDNQQSNVNDTIAYHVDSERLFRDSTAYNERIKSHQYDLLINEYSYQNAALNLSDYGVPNNVYGYISSSVIDMDLPIYLGGNAENMSNGAAHLNFTSLPIGGESTNCVLAAHTGYIGRIFFDYISTLQYGDKVQITNLWNTLTYQVIEKRIRKSYESSDCYITDGKDLLTLITCAHGGTERWYVICERA